MIWICTLLSNTVFQTVLSGTLVFILGQFFIEYILKPLQRYKQLRAKAAYCLTYYGNRYDLSSHISQETSEELRKTAAELCSFAIEKPLMIFTVKQKRLDAASSGFIGLSNAVDKNPDYQLIEKYQKQIKEALNLSKSTVL